MFDSANHDERQGALMQTIDSFKKITIGIGMSLLSAQAMAAAPGFYVSAGAGQAEQHIDGGQRDGFINLTTPAFRGQPTDMPAAIGLRLPTTLAVRGKAFGWNATLGYRLNDYFAAELAYMDFGRAQIREDIVPIVVLDPLPPTLSGGVAVRRLDPVDNAILPARFRSDIEGPALSALGSLPITARWSIYLRAGVIFAQQDIAPLGRTLARGVSFHDEVLLGGIGSSYELSPRLTLRAEYQRSDEIGSRDFAATIHLEQFQLAITYQL